MVAVIRVFLNFRGNYRMFSYFMAVIEYFLPNLFFFFKLLFALVFDLSKYLTTLKS